MDILQFNWLIIFKNVQVMGASLVIQLLRLCASNTGDAGLITGQGTKFPHAAWLKKEKNRGEIMKAYHILVTVTFTKGRTGLARIIVLFKSKGRENSAK